MSNVFNQRILTVCSKCRKVILTIESQNLVYCLIAHKKWKRSLKNPIRVDGPWEDSRRESGNFSKNNDKFSRWSFRKYGQLDIGEWRGGAAEDCEMRSMAYYWARPIAVLFSSLLSLICRYHLYFECLRKTVVFGDAFFLLSNVRSDLASLNQIVMHDIFTRMVLCKRQFNHLSL